LVDARNKARRSLRFEEADKIRDLLRDKGVTLMDEKGRRGCAMEVT
jgi:cysteinyl-tRNA synthetase